ncbi:retrovirus-related pol polyprotein from transposon TNT 1-94, partial [Tanacetum coccineum]
MFEFFKSYYSTGGLKQQQKSYVLPSPIPQWPQGEGCFNTGRIRLNGELELAMVRDFEPIWSSTLDGNKGVTFYKPVSIPYGFFALGHYNEPTHEQLRGAYVLVARDTTTRDSPRPPLKLPLDYNLISISLKEKVFVWEPIPPVGYRALGFVVTTCSNVGYQIEPDVQLVRCVQEDLTLDAQHLVATNCTLTTRSKGVSVNPSFFLIVMENPNSPNESNEVIPEVNPVIPEPNHVGDAHDPNEMVDIPDDMNDNVNDEDIEDEDVEIEPPNAESSDSVLSDSKSSYSESEDEEANIAPRPTVRTDTQSPFAIRDFPRGMYEVGESPAARDSSYVGGLEPWALRRDLEATRTRARLIEAEVGTNRTETALLDSKIKIGEKNATLKKKLKDKEMQLVIARMDCVSVERRLHLSISWNRRFYWEMVRKGAVPRPPSDDEDDG